MSVLLEGRGDQSVTGLLERLLQEDLGITNLREVCGKKALKSLFTIEWDDLRVNRESALEWAPENEGLIGDLQLNGYSQHLCNRAYLYSFYSHLRFDHKLLCIDSRATRLLGLQCLELQNNCIECLEHLPPNLKQLYLRNNCLSSVSLNIQCKGLQSLSLPYNRLDTQSLLSLVQLFPASSPSTSPTTASPSSTYPPTTWPTSPSCASSPSKATPWPCTSTTPPS